MKNYTITVNGQTYDVTVEEKGASAPSKQPAPAQASKDAPKEVAKKAPAVGANTIVSPLAGKVLSFKVKPGTPINKGDVVLVLEAMKMENDIVAPKDGTLREFSVSEGSFVEAGSVLAILD